MTGSSSTRSREALEALVEEDEAESMNMAWGDWLWMRLYRGR
jgi:hypothetical protein